MMSVSKHPPATHPPTYTHTHTSPTSHTQAQHFTITNQMSGLGKKKKNLVKCNFLVCLPPISPWPKPDISAFTAPWTLLLLHLTPLPEPLQSILTLIYHCWQAPALSLTPVCQHQHADNERANRSL